MDKLAWFKLWRALVGAVLLYLGSMAHAAVLQPESVSALRLRWEVLRTVFTPLNPGGRSFVQLSLTNVSPQPLPAQGWALYFNCIAGVDLSEVQGPYTIDRLTGTWYRLRPTQAATQLLQGQTSSLNFYHPEIMVKTAKAVTGPYLVFDREPEVGYPIADLEIAPFTRPEQWDHGANDAMPRITAEETYQRNAHIATIAPQQLPPVFPRPVWLENRLGQLQWLDMPVIKASKKLSPEAKLARQLLQRYFPAAAATARTPGLQLEIGQIAGLTSVEAYELTVDPKAGATVRSNSAAGVALGLQSLRELMPLPDTASKGVTLPSVSIRDAPRFAYRGLQLDVARNFQSKEVVFRLLDLMARYKLNKFHFHLTDDEGWRLAIAGLPELTSVGARRGHLLDSLAHLPPAYGSGPDVNDRHGSGFYSESDYIDILRHAAALHIEVIPEIEMPGHSRAAVKAMESRYAQLSHKGSRNAAEYLLSDSQDKSQYLSPQLYNDQVMNPGLESTYRFIDKVIKQVALLHRKAGVSLQTVHVGGDELANGAWEKSPATQALMRREGLDSTADVWNYFYNRVDQMLLRQGVFASGWEELGARKVKVRQQNKLIPNPLFVQRGFNLYVWNDLDDAQDLAYRMANAGYRTILTPATHLYFDMAHNKNPEEPGVNWAAYTDLDTVFDFIPFDFIRASVTDTTSKPGRDALTDFGQKQILGLEGTLFTETVRDQARMDFLLMPRMLALAERAWRADPTWTQQKDVKQAAQLHDADWSVFVNQLGQKVLPKLDFEMPGLNYRIPLPGLKRTGGKVFVNHQLPGMTLRYTTDGSVPTSHSALVSGPITESALIRVAAFSRTGRSSLDSTLDNRQAKDAK